MRPAPGLAQVRPRREPVALEGKPGDVGAGRAVGRAEPAVPEPRHDYVVLEEGDELAVLRRIALEAVARRARVLAPRNDVVATVGPREAARDFYGFVVARYTRWRRRAVDVDLQIDAISVVLRGREALQQVLQLRGPVVRDRADDGPPAVGAWLGELPRRRRHLHRGISHKKRRRRGRHVRIPAFMLLPQQHRGRVPAASDHLERRPAVAGRALADHGAAPAVDLQQHLP